MRPKQPIKNFPWPLYWCVVDLEATCDDQEQESCAVPREEMETIEIGAVMVDGHNWQVIEEFQTFIRPVRHPHLTPFCMQLTGIRQKRVEQAPAFPQAWKSQNDPRMSLLQDCLRVQATGPEH